MAPIRLVARVDRAHQLNGILHLTEFKTRSRAVTYQSDIIELSAQRLAIEGSIRKPVSEKGYVLVQRLSHRQRTVHPVQLLQKSEIVELARRRKGILNGTAVPRYADAKGLCKDCVFRQECKPDLR